MEGTHGLGLLAELHECSKLLVLDAADAGEKPGTIVRMSGDELHAVPRGKTVHQLGLADLLATLSFVSEKPPETVLLGIQPEHSGWGTELSLSVAASLDEVVDAAIEQLISWRQNDATDTYCDFHSHSVRAF